MKRLAAAVIVALALIGSANAAGPPVKNVPFKVAVPKHGKTAIYAFKLTVTLPPGTTISGTPPITPSPKYAHPLPRGTLAAMRIRQTGATTWLIIIAIDSRTSSGPGATELSGNLQVPPPLSSNTVRAGEEYFNCKLFLKAIDKGEPAADEEEQSFVIQGPTDEADKIVKGVCP